MTEDEIISEIANRSHRNENEVRNWARRTKVNLFSTSINNLVHKFEHWLQIENEGPEL